MPRSYIIPVDGPVEVRDLNGYQDYNETVGGYIEGLASPFTDHPKVVVYINEEGKIHGLPHNELATRAMLNSKLIQPTDYIAGPAIVVGFNPNTGEDLDAPIIEALEMRTADYSFGE